MVTIDGIRQLRKEAEVKINKILMQLEDDTGLKIIEEKCSYFNDREKGGGFEVDIRFESI